MTASSTADSHDAAGRLPPVVEPGATGPAGTHAVVKGEPAPRLPHERDESSDSGVGEASEVMHLAGDDLEQGHVDEPRGPETQQHYSELTEQAQREAAPG